MTPRYYEINVAEDGKHLFATAPRSITTELKARELYARFKDLFPNCQITVTYWDNVGKDYTKEFDGEY